MALISSSVKPLAMRSITVPGSWPRLKSCIAVTIVGRIAADQPRAPRCPPRGPPDGSRSRRPPRAARPPGRRPRARSDRRQERGPRQSAMRVRFMSESLRRRRPPIGRSIHDFLKSWFFSGSERMRLPVAAKIALHSAGATTATGGSPTPPQKPPLGTMHGLDLRHLGQPQHLVVVEVRLLDPAVLDGDLAVERGGQPVDGRRFRSASRRSAG